jgi:hypothetical protein
MENTTRSYIRKTLVKKNFKMMIFAIWLSEKMNFNAENRAQFENLIQINGTIDKQNEFYTSFENEFEDKKKYLKKNINVDSDEIKKKRQYETSLEIDGIANKKRKENEDITINREEKDMDVINREEKNMDVTNREEKDMDESIAINKDIILTSEFLQEIQYDSDIDFEFSINGVMDTTQLNL